MVTLPKTAETPPDDSPALALGAPLHMQSFLGWTGNNPFREELKWLLTGRWVLRCSARVSGEHFWHSLEHDCVEGVHTTGRWAGGGKTLKASPWLRRPQGERGEGECVARKVLLNALVQCKTVSENEAFGKLEI